jgi:hypothetical protein
LQIALIPADEIAGIYAGIRIKALRISAVNSKGYK